MRRESKSEIRDSEIRGLLNKVRERNYEKYLVEIRLKKIRLFLNEAVRFDFPVTALIGPNGGGKSTILGAAACAYKSLRPGTFFPKSGIGDDSMANWLLEFDIVDKVSSPNKVFSRTASFGNARWNRDSVAERPVRHFGINRTVPAGEKPQFKRFANRRYSPGDVGNALGAIVIQKVAFILGKDVSAFRRYDKDHADGFYVGQNSIGKYSEFHFGAGEASVLRIVQTIENAPDSSLILIEEIENGLHPIAVRRMVEYLIDVAQRKKIQAIFTTHSQDALDPLPPEGIWASIEGAPRQGKLNIDSLRAVSGRIDQRLAVFVEDNFAKEWLEAILREHLGEQSREVGVYAVAGDGTAVKTHQNHNKNPASQVPSLCFIDGDSKQADKAEEGIHRLPGQNPELEIFDTVLNSIDQNLAVLTVHCQRAPEAQQSVLNAVRKIALENRDPHLIFNQVGIEIGWVSENIIKGAFIALWQRLKPGDAKAIAAAVEARLNAAAN